MSVIPHGDPRLWGPATLGDTIAMDPTSIADAIGRAYRRGYYDAEVQATHRASAVVVEVRAALDAKYQTRWWQALRRRALRRKVDRLLIVSEGASGVRLALGRARPRSGA